MEFIAHRINTVEELKKLPRNFGVELDLRDSGNKLILQHDPFSDGEDFEDYLKHYNHGTMILNIKSERIEYRVLDLIKRYNIEKYFFLDSSFPMIVQLSNEGEKNIALRYSEYEGLDTLNKMAGKVKWVWVDCFSRLPLDCKIYKHIKELGYKLCLVSPELQKREDDIEVYMKIMDNENITFDAICTKYRNVGKWLQDDVV